MSFTNKYPYSDFHELNFDWIIKQLQKLETHIADLTELVNNLQTAVNDMGSSDIQSAEMLEDITDVEQYADRLDLIFDKADYTDGVKSSYQTVANLPAADETVAGVMTAAHVAALNDNTANITAQDTLISANTENIGNLEDLTTIDNTSLVGAVNEISTAVTQNASDIANMGPVNVFSGDQPCSTDTTINFTAPVASNSLLYVTLNSAANNPSSTRFGFFIMAGSNGFFPVQYATNDGYYVRADATTNTLRIITTNVTTLRITNITKL